MAKRKTYGVITVWISVPEEWISGAPEAFVPTFPQIAEQVKAAVDQAVKRIPGDIAAEVKW